MPSEVVALGPIQPRTLFPPVFPGLLAILGTPADGVSCQNIAGTTWYETTKEKTQGTIGLIAWQTATMKAQSTTTPSMSCCIPKTLHSSAKHTFPSKPVSQEGNPVTGGHKIFH